MRAGLSFDRPGFARGPRAARLPFPHLVPKLFLVTHHRDPDWPLPPAALPASLLDRPPQGAVVTVAGLVLVRQRPGTAKGVIFITLEDEFGICNVIVWQKLYQQYRRAVSAGRLLRGTGRLQRQSGVTHVIAEKVEDISPLLDSLVRLHEPTRAADQP